MIYMTALALLHYYPKGGYWEHPKTGERKWRPIELYVLQGVQSHSIELEPGVDTWTFFIPVPVKRMGIYRQWGMETTRTILSGEI